MIITFKVSRSKLNCVNKSGMVPLFIIALSRLVIGKIQRLKSSPVIHILHFKFALEY